MGRARQYVGIVKGAVVEAIRANADRIFAKSQDTAAGYVPSDKGILRTSGYKNDIQDGAEVGYRASYASIVEFGMPEWRVTGDHVVNIKPYKRKTKTGVIAVKGHQRIYRDARLVRITPRDRYDVAGSGIGIMIYSEPIFRVLKVYKERKPRLFLTRASQEEIVKLPDDLRMALRKVGKVE